MDGIINVNKPAGMTSHDVVLRIRKILKHEKLELRNLDPGHGLLLILWAGLPSFPTFSAFG